MLDPTSSLYSIFIIICIKQRKENKTEYKNLIWLDKDVFPAFSFNKLHPSIMIFLRFYHFFLQHILPE